MSKWKDRGLRSCIQTPLVEKKNTQIIFDHGYRILIKNGTPVLRLSKARARVFTTLIAHPDEVISHEQIYFSSTLQPRSLPKFNLTPDMAKRISRPLISRLKQLLQSVDKSIANNVKNAHSTGYWYEQDISVRTK